jgi:UDP-N-acetylmuramyl pentapeptide phosphotransferase/UDP-N-acetylglucosamine-1-phosphate transferase
MDKILLSGGLSFLITYFAIPIIIRVAKERKLFDEPDERKLHVDTIPTLGGLGIFAGFILASLLGSPQIAPPLPGYELQYFAAAAIIIFFLGMKDDIIILPASKKMAGQLIAAAILIKFGSTYINDMQGFLGIYQIPNVASIVLSAFTIIVITNSFNLIDGVDGLAGSLGALTSLVFGIYFYQTGHLAFAVLSFSMIGALLAFLIYNFSPAKIFMGDTGSLLVGLTNAFLAIKFINVAATPNANVQISAAPAIAFAVLMIPLFDTLRLFTLRILQRRSPFSPDRNHLHHLFLEIGLSHRSTTLIYVISNIGFILLAYCLQGLGNTLLMGILLLTGLAYTGIIYTVRHRKKNLTKESSATQSVASSEPRPIFTLASEPMEVE